VISLLFRKRLVKGLPSGFSPVVEAFKDSGLGIGPDWIPVVGQQFSQAAYRMGRDS
jgi:hypothetical protein